MSKRRNDGKKSRRFTNQMEDVNTVVLPAGTIVTRRRANGHVEEHVLSEDTIFSADCVDDIGVIMGGEHWDFTEDWD
jgi:hypothetical protein